VKVVIRNRSGNYLSGRNGGSTLTESRDMAYVYDYVTDDVEAYMTQAAKQYGGEWHWEQFGAKHGLVLLPQTAKTGI
jgi:hypothetical protein